MIPIAIAVALGVFIPLLGAMGARFDLPMWLVPAIAASVSAAATVALLVRRHLDQARRELTRAGEQVATLRSILDTLARTLDTGNPYGERCLQRLRTLTTELDALLAAHEPGTGGVSPARSARLAHALAVTARFEGLASGDGDAVPLSREEALARLRQDAGGALDPEAARLFAVHVDRLEARAAAMSGEASSHPDRDPSGTDPLTRLPDARHLFGSFDQALRAAERLGEPLSLIELDINGFAAVNGRWGRAAGDRILRGVARAIRSQLRPADTCVRYGGDEFIISVPGVGADGVEAVCSRIELAIARHKFAVERGRAITITISVGAASFPADGRSHEDMIAIADARMNQQKATRRGRGGAGDADRFLRFPGRPDVPVN
jgi:diguanylate cyclase (GGDEF)-like protein